MKIANSKYSLCLGVMCTQQQAKPAITIDPNDQPFTLAEHVYEDIDSRHVRGLLLSRMYSFITISNLVVVFLMFI